MTSKTKSLTTIGATLLLSVVPGLAQAGHDAPDEVYVRNVEMGGSGCPQGSFSINISPDKKAFTTLFDAYIAEDGLGVPARESRKNCNVLIDLVYPQGWSFTLVDVDYRGYAALDRGATAEQKSTYYFQGELASASLKTILRGPFDDDYQIRDTLALSAQVWSPCGARRALNIKSQIIAKATRQNANALITVDSIDGLVTHVYGLKWQRCR